MHSIDFFFNSFVRISYVFCLLNIVLMLVFQKHGPKVSLVLLNSHNFQISKQSRFTWFSIVYLGCIPFWRILMWHISNWIKITAQIYYLTENIFINILKSCFQLHLFFILCLKFVRVIIFNLWWFCFHFLFSVGFNKLIQYRKLFYVNSFTQSIVVIFKLFFPLHNKILFCWTKQFLMWKIR